MAFTSYFNYSQAAESPTQKTKENENIKNF